MGGMGYAAEAASEVQIAAKNIKQIGNRTFYRRANRWVDATVTKEQETRAVRVKQFSDEYFALARQHGRKLSQYLVFDEPLLINLEKQAYLIEP
jgi:hypothetical protein